MFRKARRIHRELTAAERERLEGLREQVAQELPVLIQRDQLRKNAREEDTLSGEIRRAIHESEQSLSEIARQADVASEALDAFLTGEQTLESDVIDRLADLLGSSLVRAG